IGAVEAAGEVLLVVRTGESSFSDPPSLALVAFAPAALALAALAGGAFTRLRFSEAGVADSGFGATALAGAALAGTAFFRGADLLATRTGGSLGNGAWPADGPGPDSVCSMAAERSRVTADRMDPGRLIR